MRTNDWMVPSLVNSLALRSVIRGLETAEGAQDLPGVFRLDVALRAMKHGASLPAIRRTFVKQLEYYIIRQALQSTHGATEETGRMLQIDSEQLADKLKEYGLHTVS